MEEIKIFKEIIDSLKDSNSKYISKNKHELKKHLKGQNPKAIVLTCSDSRVVPEKIFNKAIGELFVIRVAGNVAMDTSVITSIEYAVSNLKTPLLILLGHTNCGAVNLAEESNDENPLIEEIKKGFLLDKNHEIGNLKRQYNMIFKRSNIVDNAVLNKKLDVVPAIYDLESGKVDFLDFD